MICTNAILLERFVKQVAPSPYLSFNLHLDGMRETNDRVVDREGYFDTCVKMIKMLKEKGYRVQTNTTIFRETSAEEIEDLVKLLTSLGVDGMLLTPGYHYQVLHNDDIYLKKKRCRRSFKGAQAGRTTTRSSTRRFTSTTWSASATCCAVRGPRSRAIRRDGRGRAT